MTIGALTPMRLSANGTAFMLDIYFMQVNGKDEEDTKELCG